MISIEIKYNSKDTFELTKFICEKFYKNNSIAIRVIQTIFSLIMIYISVVYVKNKITLSIILFVLLLLYILVWNLFFIQNYFYSKKHSSLHQNMNIKFKDDCFILKSKSEKKSYCYQYVYSKVEGIYDGKNNLFIILDNLVDVILVPKRELSVGDYNTLVDYLKSKIDNNLIYKM